MKRDNVTFDIRQVQAITGDLQHLCRDLAQRLHQCHPDEAADFARVLMEKKDTADSFVEGFEAKIAKQLLHGHATGSLVS